MEIETWFPIATLRAFARQIGPLLCSESNLVRYTVYEILAALVALKINVLAILFKFVQFLA